jgi:5-methyltetrahydrofolate--homocysteine methyltransferase
MTAPPSSMTLQHYLSSKEVIYLDGATGTQLEAQGLEMGGQNCLSHPHEVKQVHENYKAAGSMVLTTNTLTMNRVFIQTHDLQIDVRRVNLAGARLARETAGELMPVLGNLSSTGQLLEPYGSRTQKELALAFREQGQALVEGGVDGLLIETMFDLREALCALRAIKEICSLPVMVSLAFATAEKGGRTIMGDTAKDSARQLEKEGADIVGCNCGDLDAFQLARIIKEFREATAVTLLAQSNAGKPKLVDGRTVFDQTPSQFAEGLAQCFENGARFLGGCCGTTPEHVAALIRTMGGEHGRKPNSRSQARRNSGM